MLVGSTGHGSGIPAPPPRPWRPFFSSSHHSLASSTRPPAAASAAKAEDDDAPAAAAAALAAYEDAYFNAATPLISDDAYDALKAKASRQKRKGRGVGAAPSPASALPKAAHPARLLSLDAVHSRAEAEAWGARAAARLKAVGAAAPSAATAAQAWAVEPKFDGLAARCSYEGGRLAAVVTRGDGRVGEDVTPAAAGGRILGLPVVLGGGGGGAGGAPPTLEVRGEVFITDAAFAAANAAARSAGNPPFSNPRNLAAATLRAAATVGPGGAAAASPAAAAAAARTLSFVAYELVVPGAAGGRGHPPLPPPPTTHTAALAWLASLGFSVPASASTHASFEAALDAAAAWMERRAGLGFAVDGAVLKADDLGARAALGSSPSAPRWAVAWKFPATEGVAKLTGVTWQLGRTGQLVPVAELEPTSVGGVTVARASLHNPAHVRGLGLRLGDTVVIARAGDVVPQVVRALVEARTGGEVEVRPPGACPACGAKLVGGGGEAAAAPAAADDDDAAASADSLRCVNRSCPGRALKRVQHFATCLAAGAAERRGGVRGDAATSGLDLSCLGGLGPATVAAIVDAGLAADGGDLVSLTAADLGALPGFGPVRARKVADALATAAAAAPPGAVVAGLGIPGVGRGAADALVQSAGSLAAAATWAGDEARLTAVPGIGPLTAASVARWWAADENAALVERLLAAGVGTATVAPTDMKAAGPTPPLPLAGLTFVVTGKVAGLTRAGAAKAVVAAGGKAVAGVSGSTTAVVAGESPGGAKLAAAEAAGVPVIGADAFFGEGGAVVWRPDKI
jgi:DNA ligase (NAD+)